MSLQSEVQFFFVGNKRVAEDERCIAGVEASISAPDFEGWGGALFCTQRRICVASEPGMISQGFSVWVAYECIENIAFLSDAVSLWIGGAKVDAECSGEGVSALRAFIERRRAHVVHESAQGQWNMALGHFHAGRGEQALGQAAQVLQLDSKTALPAVMQAKIYLKTAQYQMVLSAVNEAFRRQYELTSKLRVIRAHALAGLQRYSEAESELQIARKEGGGTLVLNALFDVQRALGRKQDAQLTMQELVLSEPDSEPFRRAQLGLLSDIGDQSSIRTVLAHYRKLKNADSDVIAVYTARIEFSEGQNDQARLTLARVGTGSLLYSEAQQLLLSVALSQGDYVAVESAAQVVLRTGNSQAALTTQLHAQLQLARWTDALSTIATIVEAFPSPAESTTQLLHCAGAMALTLLARIEEARPAIANARRNLSDSQAHNPFFSSRQACYMLDYLDGRLALRAGKISECQEFLRGASRIDSDAGPLQKAIAADVRKLLGQTYRLAEQAELSASTSATRNAGSGHKRDEMQLLLHALEKRLQRDVRFEELCSRLRELRHHVDQPLLVAVMGEFNVGKSTFINALLGVDVLPVDVVPTTATINVLSYSDQPSARIVWRDGATEEVPMLDLGRYVTEQQQADQLAIVRSIHHVEIGQPVSLLKPLSFVDTPGLNALTEEHQKITTEYLRSVDAILWLFRADQAGKKSEKDFLDIARQHASKTIAVVNRIDRIPKDEIAEVLELVSTQFQGYFAAVVPVSAQKAFLARQNKDNELFKSSGFPDMFEVLKAQVLLPARVIKRDSLRRKALALLDQVDELARKSVDVTTARRNSVTARREQLIAWERRWRIDLNEADQRVRSEWAQAIEAIAVEIGVLREVGPLHESDISRFARRLEESFLECESFREQSSRLRFDELATLAMDEGELDSLLLSAGLRNQAVNFRIRFSLAQALVTSEVRKQAYCLRGRLLSGDLMGTRDEEGASLVPLLVKRMHEFTGMLFADAVKTYAQATEKLLAIAADWLKVIEEELRAEELCETMEVFAPIVSMRNRFADV